VFSVGVLSMGLSSSSLGRGPARWNSIATYSNFFITLNLLKICICTYWAERIWGPLKFGGPVRSSISNMLIDGPDVDNLGDSNILTDGMSHGFQNNLNYLLILV
jgi:hypothetical protein